MSAAEVDAYLAALPEPARATLTLVRERISAIIPWAEQGISYGVPVFKVGGKRVAGFAAFAKHLTYAPHSGTALAKLGDELAAYKVAKGSFQFPMDVPLDPELLGKLIGVRLAEEGLA